MSILKSLIKSISRISNSSRVDTGKPVTDACLNPDSSDLNHLRLQTFDQPPHILEKALFYEIESPLLQYKRNVTSQVGEDGIIEKIFSIIEPKNKFCCEFGAWDGQYLSNTWNLISNHEWRGLFIEGNPNKFAELLKTYGQNRNAMCLNRFVELEGDNSLDRILEEVNGPVDLDLISIDIDGIDYFVWESITKHRPRIVVIEFNPTIPNDVIFVQARSNSVNQGCSLLALILLGKQKGYELICCTQWNAFFVPQELFAAFGIRNNHINNMYLPSCDGRIFHCYDSYIHVVGMDKLMWSGHSVDSSDFQVLPRASRRYGDGQQ